MGVDCTAGAGGAGRGAVENIPTTSVTTPKRMKRTLPEEPPPLRPNFNVAPIQAMLIIRPSR